MKLLKFIYHLGQKNENQRIKLLVEEKRRELLRERQQFEQEWGRIEGRPKLQKELDKKAEINNQVTSILDALFEPVYIREMARPAIDLDE